MNAWDKIGQVSRSEYRIIQNKKLYEFINAHVYPFSPYYRQLFDRQKINPKTIRTVEDLRRVPFTSKANFVDTTSEQAGTKQKSIDFILQPDAEKIRRYWPPGRLLTLAITKMIKGEEYVKNMLGEEYRPSFMTFTTGTTSKPIAYLYSNYDVKNLHIYGARMLETMDIREEERIVSMFPYAPHLAFWQVVFGGLSKGVLILSTGGGKVMGTDGNIAAILRMRPTVVLGVPSYVYHVIRTAQEKGHRLDSIKKVVLGAGRVTEAFKTRLRDDLALMGANDVSIFGTYGFTEARAAWVECPTRPGISSGYHLYPDKEIFEIIDPKTGEVMDEGEDGEIVYTSIDARGSVVLRYRTGDFVKGGITYQPCPHCCRTVPRLSSDITRISDIKDLDLSKIKGQLVNLNNFDACLSEFKDIKDWQIELRKRNNDPHDVDELIIYVCPEKGVDTVRLEREIKNSILGATEVSPNAILFISFEEIVSRLQLETASKEKRIMDSRPKV